MFIRRTYSQTFVQYYDNDFEDNSIRNYTLLGSFFLIQADIFRVLKVFDEPSVSVIIIDVALRMVLIYSATTE